MLQIQDDPFSPGVSNFTRSPLFRHRASPDFFPQAASTAHRPQIEHMHVKFVALARRHAPVVGRDVAAGSVDAFAVPGEPFAHLPQPFDGRRRQFSVGLGTDVEQQVSVAARSPHEVVDQRLRRFVVEVGDLVAPMPFIVWHVSSGRRPISCPESPAVFSPGRSRSKIWMSSPSNGTRWWLLPTRQAGLMAWIWSYSPRSFQSKSGFWSWSHTPSNHTAPTGAVTRQQFRELAFHEVVIVRIVDPVPGRPVPSPVRPRGQSSRYQSISE